MYLELKNISKKIKNDLVLQNISLSMDKKKIYGIFGKNGCGKTMLMRVISGLVLPTSGEVIIDGRKIGEDLSFPSSIGLLIENSGFLNYYSGLENLKMLAAMKGKIGEQDIIASMSRVGLEESLIHKKYKKYSLGMKQKLGIVAAIMEKPNLIILDEPTNALDEKSEAIFWEIIREEKERGALVFISCHAQDVLEKIADEIFTMNMGSIEFSQIQS